MKIVFLIAAVLLAGGALAQQPPAPGAAPGAQRVVVPLLPEEREHVLGEMRDFLAMLQQSLSALARGDFDAVAAAAKPLGTGGDKGRMPPAIAKKLPPEFRALARSTHGQIDAFAADAAARRDLQHSLTQAGRLLQACNACHALFQFPK